MVTKIFRNRKMSVKKLINNPYNNFITIYFIILRAIDTYVAFIMGAIVFILYLIYGKNIIKGCVI